MFVPPCKCSLGRACARLAGHASKCSLSRASKKTKVRQGKRRFETNNREKDTSLDEQEKLDGIIKLDG